MDWRHVVEKVDQPIRVDGRLDDWEADRLIDCMHPQYIKEDWAWSGPEDGWFRFGTAWDADYLYVALQSFDDRLIFDAGERVMNQDQFTVLLDARPESARLASSNPAPGDQSVLTIELAPGAMTPSFTYSSTI